MIRTYLPISKNRQEVLLNNFFISFSLLAFYFLMPISTTGKGIFLALTTISVLLHPERKRRFLVVLKEPWCFMLILFILWEIIGCVYSSASDAERNILLKKDLKYFVLPVLVVAFNITKLQNKAITSYLIAMMMVCFISINQYLGIFNSSSHDPGEVFFNHIITGVMMAFALYLSACRIFQKEQINQKLLWACLAALLSYQVFFINTGRTGYVLGALLLILLILQHYNIKQCSLGLLIIASVLASIFYYSPVVQRGFYQLSQDLHHYKQNEKNSAIGYRLQFHRYAFENFKKNPIIGNGTGSLTANFSKENPIPTWHSRPFQPHSQYWLIAAEHGVIGLIIFASFLITLLLKIIRQTNVRHVGLGILLTTVLGNYSDSLIYNSATGYFIIAFLAIGLSEETDATRKQSD